MRVEGKRLQAKTDSDSPHFLEVVLIAVSTARLIAKTSCCRADANGQLYSGSSRLISVVS